MSQRKTKLIDKQFQLKTTFTIIGIIIIGFFILIAVSALFATKNSKNIKSNIKSLEESINQEYELIRTSLLKREDIQKTDKNKISLQHSDNYDTITKKITLIRLSVKQNFHLISIMIGIILILGFALYYYLIRMTHRISGPIYVINKYIQDILDEKEPEFRSLREKDEFKDLYANFIKMVDKLKE